MRNRWGTTSLMVAALLALSCQRNLGHPFPDGGGGARSSGGGNGGSPTASAGGNGGSTTIGVGGNGGSRTIGVGGNGGSRTIGVGGNGGSVVTDAGADRGAPPPDAGKDTAPDGATPGCPVDCTHLPHVRPDAIVRCVQGKCQYFGDACEPGFANCSGNANTGCETDMSTNNNCGSCFFKCYRAANLSSPHQRRLSVRESVQRSVSRRVRSLRVSI